MARVVYDNTPHSCDKELEEDVGYSIPVGSVARCSCKQRYILKTIDGYPDDLYWERYQGPLGEHK